MEYDWKYFSGTYFDSVLIGVQFYITGNIVMVLITIRLGVQWHITKNTSVVLISIRYKWEPMTNHWVNSSVTFAIYEQ